MDTENSLSVSNVQKSKEIISYFNKDKDFVFAYKKTEKLSAAVYLVTNLFSDNEPMKWTLRKKIQEVLSFMVGYKDVGEFSRSDFSQKAKTMILEIVSLLEVSSLSGLVSFMNFSIIKQEFSDLISILEKGGELQKNIGQNNISRSFFYVEPIQQNPVQSTENFAEEKRDYSVRSETRIPQNILRDIQTVKDNFVFKRNNRQDSIINLLKKKSDLSIKDISLTVKGCSEKTIQRELITLISSGIVKKTGERRWSKYSLV
ncbi:MAG: hypothetical protein WCK48_02035 [bacterium]